MLLMMKSNSGLGGFGKIRKISYVDEEVTYREGSFCYLVTRAQTFQLHRLAMSMRGSRATRGRSATQSPESEAFSCTVEFLSKAINANAVEGRSGEAYASTKDPMLIPAIPQFAPGAPEELPQLIREGDRRTLRQLITDTPLVEDINSTHPLKKPVIYSVTLLRTRLSCPSKPNNGCTRMNGVFYISLIFLVIAH
ncbi:uncharacterized protein LOC109836346 isoform X2 [Asparagus officinalis]|uniref:uncharacterized protein LOC109836346 isoform X2 n=1 Tax=Asparagus officinalis TaxID=4686 RepID=UPI00098DFB85|nr:uncharacterized protein LOC109836346 isoform X2 [Asparagus officinalis]